MKSPVVLDAAEKSEGESLSRFVQRRLAALEPDGVFELFVKHSGSAIPWVAMSGSMFDSVEAASTAGPPLAKLLAIIAVYRGRGGKGGFGTLLAKKGRMYTRAKRRGETNRRIDRLGRNLQGERIGGNERIAAAGTDEAAPRHRDDTDEAVPRHRDDTDEAAPRHLKEKALDRQRREIEMENEKQLVRTAVAEGFSRLVDLQSATAPHTS